MHVQAQSFKCRLEWQRLNVCLRSFARGCDYWRRWRHAGKPSQQVQMESWGGLESQMCRVNRTGGAHRLNCRLTVIIGDDVTDPHGQIGLLDRLECPVRAARPLH